MKAAGAVAGARFLPAGEPAAVLDRRGGKAVLSRPRRFGGGPA